MHPLIWALLILGAVVFLTIGCLNMWYADRVLRLRDPHPGPRWLERLMRY